MLRYYANVKKSFMKRKTRPSVWLSSVSCWLFSWYGYSFLPPPPLFPLELGKPHFPFYVHIKLGVTESKKMRKQQEDKRAQQEGDKAVPKIGVSHRSNVQAVADMFAISFTAAAIAFKEKESSLVPFLLFLSEPLISFSSNVPSPLCWMRNTKGG